MEFAGCRHGQADALYKRAISLHQKHSWHCTATPVIASTVAITSTVARHCLVCQSASEAFMTLHHYSGNYQHCCTPYLSHNCLSCPFVCPLLCYWCSRRNYVFRLSIHLCMCVRVLWTACCWLPVLFLISVIISLFLFFSFLFRFYVRNWAGFCQLLSTLVKTDYPVVSYSREIHTYTQIHIVTKIVRMNLRRCSVSVVTLCWAEQVSRKSAE